MHSVHDLILPSIHPAIHPSIQTRIVVAVSMGLEQTVRTYSVKRNLIQYCRGSVHFRNRMVKLSHFNTWFGSETTPKRCGGAPTPTEVRISGNVD